MRLWDLAEGLAARRPSYEGTILAILRRLYAVATRWAASCVRARPLNLVFRKHATVFAQPKISSTRFRSRWLTAYPECLVQPRGAH